MARLFVTGVPIFLYALGVPEKVISNVVLVKILEDNQRAGIRPFKIASEAMSEICQIL